MLYTATHWAVPALNRATKLPMIVSWFVCGGLLIFLPLSVAALVFYRLEGNPWHLTAFLDRFRLSSPSWRTLLWTVLGVLGIGIMTSGIVAAAPVVIPDFSPQPSFMSVTPLGESDRWILFAWMPLFLFNILGEALFWRGYIFPRQELAFGTHTWLVHGLCWWMFHIPLGMSLLVILTPIIFITSFVVQRTKSTWSDIIIHTLINGLGFLLVAFGVVH